MFRHESALVEVIGHKVQRFYIYFHERGQNLGLQLGLFS